MDPGDTSLETPHPPLVLSYLSVSFQLETFYRTTLDCVRLQHASIRPHQIVVFLLLVTLASPWGAGTSCALFSAQRSLGQTLALFSTAPSLLLLEQETSGMSNTLGVKGKLSSFWGGDNCPKKSRLRPLSLFSRRIWLHEASCDALSRDSYLQAPVYQVKKTLLQPDSLLVN